MKQPKFLIVLDGFGESSEIHGNAVAQAKMPYWRSLRAKYPFTLLRASGEAVGVLPGQMGGSDIGHATMGAGSVVLQPALQINYAIEDKSFFTNPEFAKLFAHLKRTGGKLHIMGIASESRVHSLMKHQLALFDLCKQNDFTRVCYHAYTDGRDNPPKSAAEFLTALEQKMEETGVGKFVLIAGRMYANDRNNNWERVCKVYRAQVFGEGLRGASWREVLEESYAKEETDEFIVPHLLSEEKIEAGDAIINFCFRADRERELAHAYLDEEFVGFDRGEKIQNLYYLSFTEYEQGFPPHFVFTNSVPQICLAEVLSSHGLTQLHTAGSEKYVFITYNFNAFHEQPFAGETHLLAPSPKCEHFDEHPEMSAPGVGEILLEGLENDKYDVYIVNFENPDQLGHTGNLEATIQGLEIVDAQLAKVIPEVLKRGGEVLITADHGNCEKMLDENGGPFTAHTSNPVPCVLVSERYKNSKLREGGGLEDVAPTILELCGIATPEKMTGHSLIQK